MSNTFLKERAEYLKVGLIGNKATGWDVVVRIDGTYTVKAVALAQVQYFTELLRELLVEESNAQA